MIGLQSDQIITGAHVSRFQTSSNPIANPTGAVQQLTPRLNGRRLAALVCG